MVLTLELAVSGSQLPTSTQKDDRMSAVDLEPADEERMATLAPLGSVELEADETASENSSVCGHQQ